MKKKDFKEIENLIRSKSPGEDDWWKIEDIVEYLKCEGRDYVEILVMDGDDNLYKKEFSLDQTKYLKEILDFFYIEDDNIEKEWGKILSDNPKADVEDHIEELTEHLNDIRRLEVGDIRSGYGIYNEDSYIFLSWNG
jgi:mRNA-degrading endonuclease RelE of RelBE toxin-antitoxin system